MHTVPYIAQLATSSVGGRPAVRFFHGVLAYPGMTCLTRSSLPNGLLHACLPCHLRRRSSRVLLTAPHSYYSLLAPPRCCHRTWRFGHKTNGTPACRWQTAARAFCLPTCPPAATTLLLTLPHCPAYRLLQVNLPARGAVLHSRTVVSGSPVISDAYCAARAYAPLRTATSCLLPALPGIYTPTTWEEVREEKALG